MKKIVALLLVAVLLLTGCGKEIASEISDSVDKLQTDEDNLDNSSIVASESQEKLNTDTEEKLTTYEFKEIIPEYNEINDSNLLRFVEDNLYKELVNELDSNDYFVENVSAIYLSEEYLEELEYNSRQNVYFGYSLSELDEAFQGTRYIFTLGKNNETIVEPFEKYDDTYQRVIKNVAIGTGVILVCVTVSIATAGAPAISLIFAVGAKTGTIMALSSGALGGVASSIVTGIQTHDMQKAVKAGLLSGSEGFKWGAISGALTGAATEGVQYAKAITALKGVALNGLSTQEAAAIQMESGYPIDIIKQFHSMEEYNIYKNAGLAAEIVDGKLALIRDVDLNFKSELPDGTVVTNIERMAKGYAPLDPLTGKAFQLHHIGQKADATLAILTEAEHQGNAAILNIIGKESEIVRPAFETVRKSFWKAYATAFM